MSLCYCGPPVQKQAKDMNSSGSFIKVRHSLKVLLHGYRASYQYLKIGNIFIVSAYFQSDFFSYVNIFQINSFCCTEYTFECLLVSVYLYKILWGFTIVHKLLFPGQGHGVVTEEGAGQGHDRAAPAAGGQGPEVALNGHDQDPDARDHDQNDPEGPDLAQSLPDPSGRDQAPDKWYDDAIMMFCYIHTL